jgi:putative sterol carrier protein
MTTYQYCTPEWLAESAKRYQEDPNFNKTFQKLTMKVAFRITAEPALGIDQDIIFAAYINRGDLEKLAFISKTEAESEADYILATSPRQWAKILRKESMFAGDVMMGRIAIDKGSKPGVIKIAPYSTAFVDSLTQVDVQYPDEMSPAELEEYRKTITHFRAELGV